MCILSRTESERAKILANSIMDDLSVLVRGRRGRNGGTQEQMTTKPNRLYFGDCLEVMREDIPSESVDLIYQEWSRTYGGTSWAKTLRD